MSDFLQKFLDLLLEFIPVRIIHEWEQGVKTYRGKITSPVLTAKNGYEGTGIHFFVPLVGGIISRESVGEVMETSYQTVVLGDSTVITFSFGAKYRIRDLTMAYRIIQDLDSSVADAIRSAAGGVAVELESLLEAREVLEATSLSKARAFMRGWGVDLQELSLITFTTTPTLRLISDPEGAEEEE